MRSVWVCACGGVSVRATSVNRVRKDSRGRGFAPRLLTLPSQLRCVCLSLTRLSLPLLLRAGSLSGSASLPRGAAARGCAPRVCEERMRRASRRQSRAPRESVSAPPPPLAERQIAPGCPAYLCLCPLGWGARSAWRLGVRVRARPAGLSRFGPPPPARLFSRARRPPAAWPCAHPLTTRGDCELMSLGPSPRLCVGSRGRPRAHRGQVERPRRSQDGVQIGFGAGAAGGVDEGGWRGRRRGRRRSVRGGGRAGGEWSGLAHRRPRHAATGAPARHEGGRPDGGHFCVWRVCCDTGSTQEARALVSLRSA